MSYDFKADLKSKVYTKEEIAQKDLERLNTQNNKKESNGNQDSEEVFENSQNIPGKEIGERTQNRETKKIDKKDDFRESLKSQVNKNPPPFVAPPKPLPNAKEKDKEKGRSRG